MMFLSLRGARLGAAALVGGVFGAAYLGLVMWWAWASVGPAAWLALTLAQACWFVVLGPALAHVQRYCWWPVVAPVWWTAVELARSAWPLGGLPWGRVGFAVVDTPWSGVLPMVGVTGATVAVAALGAGLAWAGSAARREATLRSIAVPSVVVALSLVPWLAPSVVVAVGPSSTTAPYAFASVGLVQGGVPGAGNRLVEHHRQVTRDHVAETERLAAGWWDDPPDFVLWPENSTAVDPARDAEAGAALVTATRAAAVPVFAGSIRTGSDGRLRNEGVVWTDAGPVSGYVKQHLVPFGEYVPFRGLATRISSRVAAIGRDMVAGGSPAPLVVGGVRVAAAICFDVAYDDVIAPQVRRGADLVTVQTSNAMFVGTPQLDQQWAITRARALESGRSVVVASVNGVSGAIGPDGAELVRLSTFDTTSAVVQVPLVRSRTPATVVVPVLNRAVAAVALLLAGGVVVAGVGRRRSVLRASDAQSTI
jgi:apolipoprotein N-acyltransferase